MQYAIIETTYDLSSTNNVLSKSILHVIKNDDKNNIEELLKYLHYKKIITDESTYDIKDNVVIFSKTIDIKSEGLLYGFWSSYQKCVVSATYELIKLEVDNEYESHNFDFSNFDSKTILFDLSHLSELKYADAKYQVNELIFDAVHYIKHNVKETNITLISTEEKSNESYVSKYDPKYFEFGCDVLTNDIVNYDEFIMTKIDSPYKNVIIYDLNDITDLDKINHMTNINHNRDYNFITFVITRNNNINNIKFDYVLKPSFHKFLNRKYITFDKNYNFEYFEYKI